MADDDCPCEPRVEAQERRTDALSERIGRAESQLADGRVQFAELRKDMQGLTTAVADLVQQLRLEKAARPTPLDKIGDALIHWGVPLVGGGILWAIMASRGGVP